MGGAFVGLEEEPLPRHRLRRFSRNPLFFRFHLPPWGFLSMLSTKEEASKST